MWDCPKSYLIYFVDENWINLAELSVPSDLSYLRDALYGHAYVQNAAYSTVGQKLSGTGTELSYQTHITFQFSCILLNFKENNALYILSVWLI